MSDKIYLDWNDVSDSISYIAAEIMDKNLDHDAVILAPYYGGWHVASLVVNRIRSINKNDSFKPSIITESDLTRHFLVPLLSHKHIIIFDDVLDTGKVINGIIWRILHECETFMTREQILNKITICTICKKRDADYPCLHICDIHYGKKSPFIVFPWEKFND